MKEEQASRRAKSSVIGPGCSGKGVFLFFSFSLLPARFFFFFFPLYILLSYYSSLFFPLPQGERCGLWLTPGELGSAYRSELTGIRHTCRYEWSGRDGEEEGKGGRKGKAGVMGTEGSYRIIPLCAVTERGGI